MRLGAGFGGLWRDRQFLTFWSAQTVSEFGDRISELALPLIAVTLLNATPTEVGLLTAAVWLPNIISLFIGSWVDQRPDKRRLMIAADLARTAILLSLPVAFWIGALTLPQLYLVAILAGRRMSSSARPMRRFSCGSWRARITSRPTASFR